MDADTAPGGANVFTTDGIHPSPIEQAWLAAPPDSQAAFDEAALLTDQWTATVERHAGPDTRPWFVRRYWARCNRRVGLAPDARRALHTAASAV